jgi:hypothetical protein
MAKGAAAEAEKQGVLDETGEGFTWDMTNTEAEDGYPILPKGNYDAVVDSLEYQISKSKGNPMWKAGFLITEEEHASKNLKVFSYIVFTPEQMGRVKAFLENTGHADLATADFNPKKIADDKVVVGSPVKLRLDIRQSEEYGNSNEVKRIMKPGTGSNAGEGGFQL